MLDGARKDDSNNMIIPYHETYGYPQFLGNNNAYIEFLTPYTVLAQDLANARSLWNMRDVTVYSFTLQREAFRPEEYNQPYIIEVHDLTIISVLDEETGVMPSTQFIIQETQTIEAFFDDIQQALENKLPQIRVDYDQVYGYPTHIFMDPIVAVADDEIRAHLRNLVAYVMAPHPNWQPELDTAIFRWKGLNLQSYTYQYQSSSLTTQDTTANLITVFDGSVVSSLVKASSSTSTADSNTLPTMDDLFTRIQEAIHLPAFSIQVSYDELSGYPHDIYVDYDDLVANDEWIATAVYPVPEVVLEDKETTTVQEDTTPTTAPSTPPPTLTSPDTDLSSIQGADDSGCFSMMANNTPFLGYVVVWMALFVACF
jgi:hypothetical protein